MSFIYELRCKVCNRKLKYVADMDEGFDIIVDVEPCPECIKEAGKAGEDKIKVIDVLKFRGQL